MAELVELRSCGLSPMETIVAATRTTAEAYGKLDDLGTLEPSKKADLLVVDGNPLDDVAILGDESRISLVMKDGVVQATDEAHKRYYRVGEDQPVDRMPNGARGGAVLTCGWD